MRRLLSPLILGLKWWINQIRFSQNRKIALAWITAPFAICFFCFCALLLLPTSETQESSVQSEASLSSASTITITPISPLPSVTPSVTLTPSPTATPTSTTTATPTSVLESTATPTPTPSLTPSPISTATATATPQPKATPTPALLGVPARVVNVIDGDTIDVEINGQIYRVRYIGVDTPERGDPFYSEATNFNRSLVEGKTVYLQKDVSETDRYDRLLRYVYLEDGTFVNLVLVCEGYAQVLTVPPDVAHADDFLACEQQARNAGKGLWSIQPTSTPTPVQSDNSIGVIISYIYYDGQKGRNEPDEYAVIKNISGIPVNIGGWRLNAGDPGQDFIFPDFVLQPGQECRIYTNEIHPESCGFSFGSGKAIWRNSGDCGYLYDSSGKLVNEYCYR